MLRRNETVRGDTMHAESVLGFSRKSSLHPPKVNGLRCLGMCLQNEWPYNRMSMDGHRQSNLWKHRFPP